MVSIFFTDECEIVKRVDDSDMSDAYGRPKWRNESVITLECLFDPRYVRSREEINPTSRPTRNDITFFTEYPDDPSIVRDDMYVLYEGNTYRIKYVNPMKDVLGTGGAHLEICTERDTNV